MFEGGAVPYLKSTECSLEREETWTLKSGAVLPSLFVQGVDVSPRIAALSALGVLPADLPASAFKEPVAAAEVSEWARKTAALVGRNVARPFPEGLPVQRISLARYIVEAFQWKERAQNLIGRAEFESAVRGLPQVSPEERSAMAYFIVSGLYPPLTEPGALNRPMTRAEAAFYLAKAVSTYRDFAHQGYVKAFSGNVLDMVEDNEPKKLELAPNAFLLRSFEDATLIVPAVEFSGGEVVRWIETGEKVRFLQVISAPISSILDNASQYSHWQVRISREDLQDRINQFYPVGKLIDLAVRKRGSSKRAIELAIIGQEGQVRVTGMKIRQVLNLRDTLFVIDRELDEHGRVTHFDFSGRGWGHGVGLCQVGSFRMAQKGAGYEEILKKYYRGITLDALY